MRFSTFSILALTFVAGCSSSGSSNQQQDPTWEFAVAFFKEVGDDVLQNEGTQALQKHRDGARYMALLDTNPKDGKVSMAELQPFLQTPTPQTLAMLTVMVLGIERARHQ